MTDVVKAMAELLKTMPLPIRAEDAMKLAIGEVVHLREQINHRLLLGTWTPAGERPVRRLVLKGDDLSSEDALDLFRQLDHLRWQRDSLQKNGSELAMKNQRMRMQEITNEELHREIRRLYGRALRAERVALKLSDAYDNSADELSEEECYVLEAADYHPPPVDMLLFCPKCEAQHIDAPEPETIKECGECGLFRDIDAPDECSRCGSTKRGTTGGRRWLNPPHKSHLCHSCGTIWRPADVPTNGVARIKTKSEKDTWP